MHEIADFHYEMRGKDGLINKKHTHAQYYEILHICRGSGSITVNDRLLPLREGTVVLINGMDTHCSVPDDAAQYVRSKLVIASSFVRELMCAAGSENVVNDLFAKQSGLCIGLSSDENAGISAEMRRINEKLGKSENETAYLSLALLKILLCAYENINKTQPPLNNGISDILAYLNGNIAGKIELSDLCRRFHISRYYLCRLFKKSTGMTIFEYVQAQRVSEARKKLFYTDDPMGEIALSLGFSSFSYFSKTFREYEGMTPSAFRAKAKRG